MPSVADLSVHIGADTKDAESGIDRVSSKLGGVGDAAKIAAVGLLAIGGGIAAGLGAAAKSAADFDQQMSAVQAVSGASGAEMSQLSALALQLGKDTAFSASEAAEGLGELVKGGVSIPDIMNGAAQATLSLAAAGGTDLATAAGIAATALSVFNLSGKDMGDVVNQIAGFANATKGDVNSFNLALNQAGAVAKLAGQDFDSTAVAIGLMGKAGILGSDAGTSLKTMLLNLQPQTKQAAAEMQALGIITADGSNKFVDAQGHIKSMADISGVLHDATANLTDAQKAQALQTIFGTDAIRAAAIMADAGTQGFNDMADAMSHVSASDVANMRLDNLAGDMQQLQGSAETLAITVGEALQPGLRAAAQGATQFLNGLIPLAQTYGPALATALQSGAAAASQFAQNVQSGALGALNGLQATLAATGPAWAPWAAQAGAAGQLVNGMLTAATGGLQSLSFLLQGNLPAAVTSAQAAFASLGGALGLLTNPIAILQGLWGPLADGMSAFAPTGERIGAAFAAIGAALGQFIPQPLGDAVTGLTDAGTAAATSGGLLNGLADIVNGVSAGVQMLTDRLSEHKEEQAALVGILTAAATAWGLATAASIAHTAAMGAATIATGILTAAQTALDVVLDANPISLIIIAIAGLAAGLIYAYNNIQPFHDAVDATFSAVTAAAAALWAAAQPVLQGLGDLIGQVAATFQANGGDIGATMLALAGDVLSALGNLAVQAMAAAEQVGADMVAGLVSGITARAGQIASAAANMVSQAIGAARAAADSHSPSREMELLGTDMGDGLQLGLLDSIPKVEAAAKTVAQTVLDTMQSYTQSVDSLSTTTIAKFDDIGEKMGADINAAIMDAAKQITAAQDQAVSSIQSMLDNQAFNASMQAQRNDLASQQARGKSDMDANVAAQDAAWQHEQNLAHLKRSLNESLAKATTDQQRQSAQDAYASGLQQLQDQEDDARAQADHQKQMAAEVAKFQQSQAKETADLETRIQAEQNQRAIAQYNQDRDNRITAINQALADKEKKITEDADTERKKLIADYGQRVQDLQDQFVSKLPPVLGNAQSVLDTFLQNVQAQTASVTADMIAKAGAAASAVNDAKAAAASLDAIGATAAANQDALSNTGPKLRGALSFDTGGLVPGPIGAPVPAIVHGGEVVIPAGGSITAPIDYALLGQAVAAALRAQPPVVRVDDVRQGLNALARQNGRSTL